MNPSHMRPVAIVTGGSRGIGRRIVERLHADGHAVLFTHSSSDAEAAALQAALDPSARSCRALRLDVTAADAAPRLFDAAEALGPVAALINNAGVTGQLGPIEALDDACLERILAVNLAAPVRLCREAALRWRGRDARSDIVNISSVAARTGSPGEYVAYAASKAALEALTVGLARELAPQRIHVNAVAPGTIDTTIHARAGEPGRAARVAARIPMQRPGQPEEVAAAVAWLLSAQASYGTGSVLAVTGGL
ncbi:SDR family NAD(P)-dependent oxidoreductase [Pseudoxanthomonas suwonensis]|uniref:SDR family NAD(P)-dependent oxidoreductase n=1 Tax=Pseudoxanthomonas suwonensis TaxID=314722 RepID=UPI00138F669C|nr:SDR family oxidoreductase [Pseudoxanthomonas suwonensis]KAF1702290.1 oxidoreductase [Pseudoxanthomonas suwonensis]